MICRAITKKFIKSEKKEHILMPWSPVGAMANSAISKNAVIYVTLTNYGYVGKRKF